jgi:hypothetical protein
MGRLLMIVFGIDISKESFVLVLGTSTCYRRDECGGKIVSSENGFSIAGPSCI